MILNNLPWSIKINYIAYRKEIRSRIKVGQEEKKIKDAVKVD